MFYLSIIAIIIQTILSVLSYLFSPNPSPCFKVSKILSATLATCLQVCVAMELG